MAVSLPGPDAPPRTIRLPPRPDRPPKRKKYPAPKGYLGGWKQKPTLSPKKFKTIRTGKGYYIAKKLAPPKGRGGKGKGPGAPAAAPGPYDRYKGTPWEGYFEAQDAEQRRIEQYASGQVLPWLSGGLRALTGVDPAAPGYNQVVQQQYLANVAGPVGNALNAAAAAAAPVQFGATTPGASTAAPNAYLGRAMGEYAAQRGGSAILAAQAQATLNTVQPNIYAVSAMRSVADTVAGMPTAYVTRRNAERLKIDQFLLEFEESKRHAKVMEAISSQNAITNAAIQFGRLGLSASELTAEQAQEQADRTGQVPYGFVRLPDGRIVRDPSVPSARAPSPDGGDGAAAPSPAKGQYPANKLKKEGFVGGWKVKPKNKPKGAKGTFVRATDGTWWIKPGTVAKPKGGGTTPENLRSELDAWYFDKIDGKYDEPAAVKRVGNWILSRKGRFTKGGKANISAINSLLTGVIGTGTVDIPAQVLSWLKNYIGPDGRWK